MFCQNGLNLLRRLALQEKTNLMTARVSMLLKSRASLSCLRACFLPGRAKYISTPRYMAEDYYIIGIIIYSQYGQLRFVTTFEP